MATALGRLRRGMLIVDTDLRVLCSNEAAREICSKGDAVVDADGRIALRRSDAMTRLEQYLATPCDENGIWPELALRLERSNGERPYRMWASPLSNSDDTGEPETYLVMIFDPDTGRRIDGKVLADLYGLTRTEAEIALRLFQGLTVGEVAADLKISPNTARTHLRSIFRKCEVESQSQLLQLMSLGPRGL